MRACRFFREDDQKVIKELIARLQEDQIRATALKVYGLNMGKSKLDRKETYGVFWDKGAYNESYNGKGPSQLGFQGKKP